MPLGLRAIFTAISIWFCQVTGSFFGCKARLMYIRMMVILTSRSEQEVADTKEKHDASALFRKGKEITTLVKIRVKSGGC